ncbi:unnamed protein product [Mycena citricolor]|uniref:Uncharacterized protein n=1 Tax=Mycena citricolor TaxID=2018698 RepID=A0AAD2H587_9AGAR|nr:unnamed protein product [Mycena citricolor]
MRALCNRNASRPGETRSLHRARCASVLRRCRSGGTRATTALSSSTKARIVAGIGLASFSPRASLRGNVCSVPSPVAGSKWLTPATNTPFKFASWTPRCFNTHIALG